MKNEFYTLYSTSYGVVSSHLKQEMTFEEAEALGKAYCKEHGFVYDGTYTFDEIEEKTKNLLATA